MTATEQWDLGKMSWMDIVERLRDDTRVVSRSALPSSTPGSYGGQCSRRFTWGPERAAALAPHQFGRSLDLAFGIRHYPVPLS